MMPPARPRRSIPRALLVVSVLAACGGGGGSDGGDSSSDGTSGVASTTATTSGVSITDASVTLSTTDPGTGDGTCCAARSEAGCSDDPEIAACVCAVDRFCCENVWDAVCGEKVAALGCGVCDPTSTTTTPTSTTASDESTGVPTGENVGPCCAAHVETGCELPSLAECVCASVPSCCLDGWGEDCVAAVGDFGCGVCPPAPTTTTTETTTSDTGSDTGVLPDNTESCCSAHASTGCEYPGIAECVCGPHPECCDTAWDETCVAAVGALGCGVCPPG